ncbi:Gfo/Idh/MocA family protein [Geobacter sp. SVR]|uniref:Gfo/Idh/MocA family protein n=1 Tax=Geobacter sp. SVR TaxID=2495594 RepID=UPI00143EFC88|nr:Gfo/Idh/MocA family oxidoreductase [Geobacter sp. SVR]BCS52431.1 UDP-N-acetylglucosamine 3-dehydrogenase [Geobacter sp. SVR]GCF87338.1 UDP-N-acetylglucosamine 3-dehydrogenase [Geobacter sp. SVR]
MSALRTAVIGVGYLGNFHAQKYASLSDVELVGVVDSNPARAAEIAAALGTTPFSDYRELIGRVDAVSIVVPTQHHHEVARDFLAAGVHVLIEKPITVTIEEADDLITLAEQHRAVFQVGHLERFNPVLMALDGVLQQPLFIESVRIAPFKPRGTDVNVVLDLMIHDIDIIQHIVKSPVERIDAIGSPVFTGEEDIANARILFKNGCVANVTASRISLKSERKMRIFQRDAYITLDFQNRKLLVARKGNGELFPGVPNVKVDERELGEADALRSEIESFIAAVRTGNPPEVSGHDGRMALETALKINQALGRK